MARQPDPAQHRLTVGARTAADLLDASREARFQAAAERLYHRDDRAALEYADFLDACHELALLGVEIVELRQLYDRWRLARAVDRPALGRYRVQPEAPHAHPPHPPPSDQHLDAR